MANVLAGCVYSDHFRLLLEVDVFMIMTLKVKKSPYFPFATGWARQKRIESYIAVVLFNYFASDAAGLGSTSISYIYI